MTAPRPTDDKATDYETSRREAMAAARHAIIALRDAAGVPEAALAHGYKVTAGCVTDDLGRVSAAISNYFLDAEPALRDRLAAVERERDEARADLAVWVETWKTAANGVLRLMGEKEAVERERDEARRVGRLDGREANNLLVWAEGAEERVNAAVARAVAAEARLAAVAELAHPRGSAERRDPALALGRMHTVREILDILGAAPSPQAATKEWRPTMSCCRSASEHELHRPSPQAEPAENPWCERCPTSNEINNASHKAWHARWDAAQAEPATCDHGLVGAACRSTFNGSAEHCPGPQSTEETQP